ncbi:hypothetical protein EPN28_04580 [Patescibacteria group bacterium]|nr:MAG: hypothetical protein EPN28_04580 [Patescibacteria group bacterium]
MGRFKKGLLLGGLVGAALVWLNLSPKGKEMRDKMKEHLENLFAQLKESIKKLEGPTREMYDALVERAVEEYAAKKELAIEWKNKLVKELKRKWEDVEDELRR